MLKLSRFLKNGAAAGLLAAALILPACADEAPKVIPAAQLDAPKTQSAATETAVLSGGCFWGMQGVFEHLKGVKEVVSGYSGGAAATAQYELVSTGTTGAAETVKITFDPRQVSYGEILRVYFSVAHDPTQLNRQGPDEGTQYRSDIWYTNDMQKKIADAYIRQLGAAHVFGAPIVTRVDAYRGFYPAESYHQDYLIHNPDAPYIVYNDLPKIAAFKRLYAGYYRETPVMVGGRS
ncbi:MAG TPA: peptide-methionine (S)-S-oxide reductase MsrA [Rhizomicrobium sp.]|nr:peptide-methionine (S)-S-oxide reductase MsrA [Rhizomicrobium sp.]